MFIILVFTFLFSFKANKLFAFARINKVFIYFFHSGGVTYIFFSRLPSILSSPSSGNKLLDVLKFACAIFELNINLLLKWGFLLYFVFVCEPMLSCQVTRDFFDKFLRQLRYWSDNVFLFRRGHSRACWDVCSPYIAFFLIDLR